ncbi:MAG: hypothetical protein A2Z04_01660 [Chloroflexi bacterium RBG_16_57_9]|nr:MAG: hypothetical protein A2Z04_01660 [Chloroflexi bacterium RBG_16_57_9]
MNVTIQIPDYLNAEFEQRARERYGEAGPARALQEAIALWLEAMAESDGVETERALNNLAYHRLKAELQREYQGKYVVIAHSALQGVGDTLEQVASLAPEARHRLLFRVGKAPHIRVERLWQMQRN